MFGVVCPQCKKSSKGAACRLVKDACGHEKCRMCLLDDEENCKQCKPVESEIQYENHTGVIASNGTAKKTAQNGIEPTEMKAPLPVKPKAKLEDNRKMYHNITIPNHVSVLKDPLQYKCNICSKVFNTKSHIKYHVYCTGKAKPFKCSNCSKEFVTKAHLELHLINHTGVKQFTCNVCQKSFGEKSKLKRHSVLHSGTKPYVCTECGKAFRSKESLKIHTLIHRGEKPYSCRICSLRFNNTSNLNKHLISHSNEKSYMCDECGKTFKLNWALTVHRRAHLRVRPFECSTCKRSFVNNKDLQRHQLIHLETKAFTCNMCQTSFRRKDNLYRHVKNAHPGKKQDPISVTVKDLLKPTKPVENPNAINVITASPAFRPKSDKPATRTGTVINGPLKLAFKTNAFKNNYNIHRDYDLDLMSNSAQPYDLAKSVNICQKILSPSTGPARNIIRTLKESPSAEINPKILSPSTPLHYETSFGNKKHAIVKNIKFKVPSDYTNINLKDNESFKKMFSSDFVNIFNDSPGSYLEPNAGTSVIVNGSQNGGNNVEHWRRRTAQNLSKALEN